MPRMDGAEAFRRMRQISPDVRVILASGYNEQEIEHRFAHEGIAAFIQKPFRLEQLREKVAAVLRSESPEG